MFPIEGLADKLQQNFDVAKAAGLSVVVQFEITDAGNSYLIIDKGCCQFCDGDSEHADVAISMDIETLYNIIEGRISGMQGFMFGKVSAVGDQHLAAKLDSFFIKKQYS